MAVGVVCLIVVAYFRPQNALLVLAALAPLGGVWSPLVSDSMRGAEVLVLAFLAGALLRGWTLHRFRNVALGRLQIAALLFGLIVSLSCVHELWLRSVEPRDLLEYVAQDYVTSFRGYGLIFHAMLLIEGLALLLYASALLPQRSAEFTSRLVRMLVIGGIAAAAFNFWFFVHELIETGQPAAVFWDFFLNRRWSAHVGDVNAAGSFFAMIMFMALGLAVQTAAYRLTWFAAGLIAGLALWMTASRTALVAAVIVGFISLATLAIGRARRWSTVGISWFRCGLGRVRSRGSVPFVQTSECIAIAAQWTSDGSFSKQHGGMIQAHPLFGVGIGQYPQWSAQYSSAGLHRVFILARTHTITSRRWQVNWASLDWLPSWRCWRSAFGRRIDLDDARSRYRRCHRLESPCSSSAGSGGTRCWFRRWLIRSGWHSRSSPACV